MQTVTDRFLATSRSSSKVVVSADLYSDGSLVLENMPVSDASVSMDLDSDVLRSAHITTVATGEPNTPTFSINLLNCEVILKAGYKYSNQTTELVSLGRFMIWQTDKEFHDGEVMSLELYDRAKYMEMNEIVRPLDYSGQLASVAIQNLVDLSLPMPVTVTFETGVNDVRLPGGSTYDTNHLEAAIKITDSLGGKFTFDEDGNPVVIKKPVVLSDQSTSTAVYALTCGEDGNIVTLSKQISRESVYNGVAVYGAATENGAQPFGEAYDLNPSSPTYWNGPFGKALKKIEREELLTPADCILAARAELKASTSGLLPVNVQILPNPALVAGDVVTVLFPDLVSVELHMIKSIDFDLSEMSMHIQTMGRSSQNG